MSKLWNNFSLGKSKLNRQAAGYTILPSLGAASKRSSNTQKGGAKTKGVVMSEKPLPPRSSSSSSSSTLSRGGSGGGGGKGVGGRPSKPAPYVPQMWAYRDEPMMPQPRIRPNDTISALDQAKFRTSQGPRPKNVRHHPAQPALENTAEEQAARDDFWSGVERDRAAPRRNVTVQPFSPGHYDTLLPLRNTRLGRQYLGVDPDMR
jgi:hypothetical protein